MPLAFTRAVSPRIVDCALTHLDRQAIDPILATEQHAAYERALGDAGFIVHRFEYLAEDPDAVFVEDTAVLLGTSAIITRPGTASRRDEVDSTARGLESFFRVLRLASGNLDGGDVLKVGNTLYVGRSNRTDAEGAESLAEAAAPLGYKVVPVELGQCLHLKTAVTLAGWDAGHPVLLANPEWVDPAVFGNAAIVEVAHNEPFGANVVLAGTRLIYAKGSPATAARLRERDFDVVELDLSELQKAEAGGTCMSLIAD
jgi:N-Dimethylarginine dimethylaminohydrolase